MASYLTRSSRVGGAPLAGRWPSAVGMTWTPTFPNLRGIAIGVKRRSVYATSSVVSVTGREQRTIRRRWPRHHYQLAVEVLDDGYGDVATFVDFILAMRARAGEFVFTDPYDGQLRVCRLDSDEHAIDQIVNGLWSVAQIDLVSVKTGPDPVVYGASLNKLPAFPGVKIEVKRTPFFGNTVVESEAGFDQVTNWFATPRWKYNLALEFVRVDDGEAAQLAQFIDDHVGSLHTFYFTDPYSGDDVVVRFDQDEFEVAKIVEGVWEMSNLSLVSVS